MMMMMIIIVVYFWGVLKQIVDNRERPPRGAEGWAEEALQQPGLCEAGGGMRALAPEAP